MSGRIFGTINDEIYVVRGYHRGMAYTFNEAELFDWTITDPSGNEEGNVVGKFLDTFQGKPPC